MIHSIFNSKKGCLRINSIAVSGESGNIAQYAVWSTSMKCLTVLIWSAFRFLVPIILSTEKRHLVAEDSDATAIWI